MPGQRDVFLWGGLALAGYAAVQLTKKPAAPPGPAPISCPPGYHVEGSVCVQDPPPPPPAATGPRVTSTLPLIVRSGPGTQYGVLGSLSNGTAVTIACQGVGQPVMSSAIWDRISAPIAGWVSDYWISTPNVGRFSPGYAVCAGSPPVPVLPPTGGGALSALSQLQAAMIVATGCSWGDADYLVVAAAPYATLGRFGRIWIADKFTWDGLGVPRSVIRVVTPGLLYNSQFADAGSLRRQVIRGYGLRWVWSPNHVDQWLLPGSWSGLTQKLSLSPPRVLATAGSC